MKIKIAAEGAIIFTSATKSPFKYFSTSQFHPMQVGDAWFEDGKIPVHAIASTEVLTAFIRVSILPREILGKSSIMYVDPEDANRSKPRTYTVYVDEPIEI